MKEQKASKGTERTQFQFDSLTIAKIDEGISIERGESKIRLGNASAIWITEKILEMCK